MNRNCDSLGNGIEPPLISTEINAFSHFFRSGGRLFADGAGAAAVLGLFPLWRRQWRSVVDADGGADGGGPHARPHHHRRRTHRQDGQEAEWAARGKEGGHSQG